jgi:hypothetical protein
MGPRALPGIATHSERGSAIVIMLFILALVSAFAALALIRMGAEASAVGNENAEARAFYAAQGSLETMTRNFNKVFEVKLNPTLADLNSIQNAPVAGLTNFNFIQQLTQSSASANVVLSGGPYSGLYALRDSWRLRTTATDTNGVQVQLTRNILNSRIPIFQFGVFYDDDLELFNGPTFNFGGRVHSNGHFFIHPSANGAFFDSRVTASGHIVTQTKRNGDTVNITSAVTQIRNASGTYQRLFPTEGSVLNGTPNVFTDPQLPSSRINPNWASQSAKFDGNLQAQTKTLKLPLKVGGSTDLVEILRRPKNAPNAGGGDLHQPLGGSLQPVSVAAQDDEIIRSERYANKTGIRISLADSKAKLPGCSSGSGINPVTTNCGVRLDGHRSPTATGIDPDTTNTATGVAGYQPLSMRLNSSDTAMGYVPTRLNGERFKVAGRQVWIKVELVSTDQVSRAIITRDITEDFLALGLTEATPQTSVLTINSHTGTRADNGTATVPSANLTATNPQTASTLPDSRSILKLQRWLIKGPAIPGGGNVLTSFGTAPETFNYVQRWFNDSASITDSSVSAGCGSGCGTADDIAVNPNSEAGVTDRERYAHLKRATVNSIPNRVIVPFPIGMFDTREGAYFDQRSTTYYTDITRLTRNGIMSMVDIDVANLRRFMRGDFNGLFPTTTPFAASKGGAGLTNTDVPQSGGWVVYVSDRRGDADFDGEFDMEDIYSPAPGNTGTLQPGEDLNGNNTLDTAYGTETERYNTNTSLADMAAVKDHRYYRRGVRLTNATVLPGLYDAATPANTRGVSFASENGIYVQGNFNATGVLSVPSDANTPFNHYLPFDTSTHIPSSVVGDAVTILSNNWNDGQSFASPYSQSIRNATTTQMRFAMIAGDTITSLAGTPNQGGSDPRLNGGLHNFKRFLEHWGTNRLDYTGSLINLYNSRNSNGSFKCCNTVYNPPIRNWVFDATFLDPTRLPPGTPFFQYIQTTGFERAND